MLYPPIAAVMIVTASPSQSWCVGQASRGMTRWLTASAVWSSVVTTGDTASSSEVPAGRSWRVLLIVTCISHIKRKRAYIPSSVWYVKLLVCTAKLKGLTSRVSQYESLHDQRVVVLFAYASIIWIRSRVSSQPLCSRTVAPLRVYRKGNEKISHQPPLRRTKTPQNVRVPLSRGAKLGCPCSGPPV